MAVGRQHKQGRASAETGDLLGHALIFPLPEGEGIEAPLLCQKKSLEYALGLAPSTVDYLAGDKRGADSCVRKRHLVR